MDAVTTTIDQTDIDVDLEQWVSQDDASCCEQRYCDKAAEWVIAIRPTCSCFRPTSAVFCSDHKQWHQDLFPCACWEIGTPGCGGIVSITLCERIRSPR